MEPVLLIDRVRTSIALGESHFREFKSAWQGQPNNKSERSRKDIAKDIASTMVGFANADGGELLIGVEDNGDITGIPNNEDLARYLLNSWKDGVHKSTPLANVRAAEVLIDSSKILYFSVLKSVTTIHQTADGKCLQRRDLETVPVVLEDIQFTRQEKLSQEYDRAFIDGAKPDALDLEIVRLLAEQISNGMSPEKCLQYLDLADFDQGYIRLRRAALLLFANDPVRWHPRLQIRILRVNGTEIKTGAAYNVGQDKLVQGNVVTIVDKAWEALRPELVQTKLSGAAKFENRVMYPELACREALINAVAHRDYSQEGRGIEIYIYDDRMEVSSPGGLLSSLTVADLKRLEGAHQSRNSLVARALREMGYMREVGEGMRRIFELMQSNELAEPQIETSPDKFTVILSNNPIYNPEHLLWLDSFSHLNLSREEKSIIVLGYGGRLISTNDIWNTLGLVDTERYRQLVYNLQSLDVLISSVSKATAKRQAKNRHTNFRDVPRFAIQIPGPNPSRDRSQQKRTISPSAEKTNALDEELDPQVRLFIGNLPTKYEKEQFVQFIRGLGIEGDVSWPRAPNSAFTFLQLDNQDATDHARETINGKEFLGRRLHARPAFPRRQ